MRPAPKVGRLATPADEDATYRLLLGLERDNGIGYPHDEAKVRQAIRQGTERRGGYVVVIDDPDRPGEVVGSVGITWGEFWYGGTYLAEQWLFVDPEHRRGTGYADALMDWAKWFRDALQEAAGRDIPCFTSVTSRKRFAAKQRWWRRRGEQVGAIFLLR